MLQEDSQVTLENGSFKASSGFITILRQHTMLRQHALQHTLTLSLHLTLTVTQILTLTLTMFQASAVPTQKPFKS